MKISTVTVIWMCSALCLFVAIIATCVRRVRAKRQAGRSTRTDSEARNHVNNTDDSILRCRLKRAVAFAASPGGVSSTHAFDHEVNASPDLDAIDQQASPEPSVADVPSAYQDCESALYADPVYAAQYAGLRRLLSHDSEDSA